MGTKPLGVEGGNLSPQRQNLIIKQFKSQAMKVEISKSTISITGLTPNEAQQIKMAQIKMDSKTLPTTYEENLFCYQLIYDINEAQIAVGKVRECNRMYSSAKNGLISIPKISDKEAFHIKTALGYLSKEPIRGSNAEDRSFVSAMIDELSKAITAFYKQPEMCM